MANILEYTLSLNENLSAKLKKIGINSDEALDVFSELQKQTVNVNKVMGAMGTSIGTLSQKLELLRREKEWIPAGNEKDLRRYNKEIHKLEQQINRLNTINGSRLKKWFGDLKAQVPMLNAVTNPIALVGVGIYKLSGYLQNSAAAYKEESVQVTKLQQIMQNTMGATGDQVKSILDLASAQQKLGVIGDETQLSGAQELATYITKKESLEKLMPAMNDMLAQQYGLNATQEQATTIAQMMGKVLDGQVGALSRYGYHFTEAQEKVLKYGNEQERVAMLSEVVSHYVGGVNEALAQTPEGKLKNAANNMGDLQERVGGLFIAVQAALIPLRLKIQEIVEKIIVFFEQNKEKILAITGAIAGVLGTVFGIIWDVISAVGSVIGSVITKFSEFIGAVSDGNPIALALAGAIGMLSVALAINYLWTKRMIAQAKLKNIWDKITVFWTNLTTGAFWKLTVAMLSNPVTWIILGVVALIGTIAWLIMKLDGWKETWENLVKYMSISWDIFKANLTYSWMSFTDTFLSGIELIEKAWYKLQSLWDKEGASAGLSKIESKQWERAQQIAEAKGKLEDLVKQRDAIDVIQLKWNDTKLSDVIGGIKSQLGIAPPIIPGSENSNVDPENPTDPVKPTTEVIATGGTKNNVFNISLGKLVENINISKAGGFRENANAMSDEVLDLLSRVLSMAQSTV